MPARKALISGSSSGVGEALAKQLLEAGWEVIGIARDFSKSPLDHPAYQKVALDLSQLDRLPTALEKLLSLHGDVEAAICNAGQGRIGSLEELSYRQMRETLDLNFLSQAYLCRALIPAFKRRRAGQIVLMGSESALQGRRQGSIYCASKFALRGFAQALREELAASGVRVQLVNPGIVRTPFFDDLRICPSDGPGHALEPCDIANVVYHLLEAPRHLCVDEINVNPLHQKLTKKLPSKGCLRL